jgi:hypothetical protein
MRKKMTNCRKLTPGKAAGKVMRTKRVVQARRKTRACTRWEIK